MTGIRGYGLLRRIKMKRIYALLTSAALLLSYGGGILPDSGLRSGSALTAYAADEATSGDCGALEGNVKWEYDGNGTLTISGSGAMKNYYYSRYAPWYDSIRHSIKNVVIKEGVTIVGDYAFYGCSALEQVTLPESLTEIGSSAFSSCDKLKSISVPAGVEKIGSNAFDHTSSLERVDIAADNANYCSVDDVLFTKDLKRLMKYPPKKEASTYAVPEGTVTIDGYAFSYSSNLTAVTLPDTLTAISNYAFSSCVNLTEIAIPDSVTTIGDRVFVSCQAMTKITVGANNTAFCAVDGVLFSKDQTVLYYYPVQKETAVYTIPDGVTELAAYAFQSCEKLTEVTIPDSVTKIGLYSCDVFANCKNLEKVTLSSGLTALNDNLFKNCSALKEIVIPEGSETIRVTIRNVGVEENGFRKNTGSGVRSCQGMLGKSGRQTAVSPA